MSATPPPPPPAAPPPGPTPGPTYGSPTPYPGFPGGDPPWPPTDARHDAGDPDEAFPPGISLLGAFGLVGWSFLAQLVVVAVIVVVGVDPAALTDVANVGLVGVMEVVTLVGVVAWVRITGRSLWRLFGPIRPSWRHVAMGVGLGLTGLLLVQVAAAVVMSALPGAQPPSQALLEVDGGPLIIVGQVVVAVLLAPIVEELTYRGALFQASRSMFGLVGGIVLSALVFAGVHVEVWASAPAIFGLLVLGLWLAAVFHRTGSLVVPIVAHATFNGVTLALSLLVPPIT